MEYQLLHVVLIIVQEECVFCNEQTRRPRDKKGSTEH